MTSRLKSRVEKLIAAVGVSSRGGAKSRNQSLRPQIASAPSGCLEDFRFSISAWTTRSRSTGSATPTGSGPRIAVSLLPSSPCSFSVRIETGTSAFISIPSTWTPRSSSQRRRAPAVAVRMTSLTVTPKAFLIDLKSLEREARPGEAPLGADLDVERHLRRPPHQVPRHLPDADDAVHRAPSRPARPAHGATEPARHPPQGLPDAARGAAGERGAGGRLVRAPGLLRANRLGGRLDVEEEGADVDRREAVGERVVGLVDDREAVVLEALDQDQLPERARAIEGRREDLADEIVELGVVAGGREADPAHVVGQVEVGIVDPEGRAQAQRREGKSLAQARQEVDATADVGDEVLVAGRLPAAHEHGADRHVPVAPLVGQERRVERSQPVHMAQCHASPFSLRESVARSPQGNFLFSLSRFDRAGGRRSRPRRRLLADQTCRQ